MPMRADQSAMCTINRHLLCMDYEHRHPAAPVQWPSQLSRRLAFSKKTSLCHFDEQAKGTSLDHGLYPTVEPKLREDIAYMTFDGIDLHDQRLRNLLIRAPLRQQTDHLPFACGQAIHTEHSWLRL